MDLDTALSIFSLLNPKPMLNEEEQSLFDRAADILEENCLLDEKGELKDEDQE
jgi:hypothetical protein